MASIVKRPNGHREIRVILSTGNRPTIRLGRCDQKTAEGVRLHVERLAFAVSTGTAPPPDTAGWISSISDQLHARLARAGLCEPRAPSVPPAVLTVGVLVDAFIGRRDDLKPGTILVLKQARRHLVRKLGEGRDVASITIGDAKDFDRSMRGDYSIAYSGKMVRCARQIWRDAIDRKTLTENPWLKVKVGSNRNVERQRFIPRATIDKVIAEAPDPQWKLLIALARYAGLRVPSEPLGLTWSDIDFDKGRMLVRSPKTEHHAGKGSRVVPIFPEVREHLEAVFARDGADGEVYVITRFREKNANLRTQFGRFIAVAKVEPWPRLFQNLRSSCATELVERFPAHVVNGWLGHTEEVAQAHYRSITDAHFDAASGAPGQSAPECAPATSGNKREERKCAEAVAAISPENAETPGNPEVSSWEREDSNL